jgi:hypothetical protein
MAPTANSGLEFMRQPRPPRSQRRSRLLGHTRRERFGAPLKRFVFELTVCSKVCGGQATNGHSRNKPN